MFEYWIDENEEGEIIPIKMPYKYVIESFCDMAGASKAYNPKDWKPVLLWKYWVDKCEGKRIMHPLSTYLVKKLIWMLYIKGEYEFFDWYKQAKKYLKEHYEKGDMIELESEEVPL